MTTNSGTTGENLHLPDPTPWPMVMALGVTLLAAGLVTQIVLSGVGVVLVVSSLLLMVRDDIAAAEAQKERSQ